MHDTDEILATFTFKNSETPAQNVTLDGLVYELFQQVGASQIKVTSFDLTPAAAAELLTEFPTNTPTNGVWVSGRALASPVGTFSVKATATQQVGVPVLTLNSPSFTVIRDPSIATTGIAGPLSAPRPRTH